MGISLLVIVTVTGDNGSNNSLGNRGIDSMEAHGLSKKELEHVFKFEGFGNKAGPLWFLGIEEGGGSIEQLRIRAKSFDLVEDIRSVERIGYDVINRHVPTWHIMSKLILAMRGNPDWQEKSRAQEYQNTELGRIDGDTFLTELMPLPCPNIKAWPYESICPTKEAYTAMVRPGRIRWLRSEIVQFKPRAVICYGKGNWPYHKEIFSDVEFEDELDGKIQIGRDGRTTILLIPFLSPDLVKTAMIPEIAKLIEFQP
jgi:hypothetical protein